MSPNSRASAVGAKALTIRRAIFVAGILNCLGATLIGAHVTNTILKGTVSTDLLGDPHLLLIGALAALLASALWVSFATWKSLPVSTTHSIVGAMIGFGIMARGFAIVNWGKLDAAVAGWITSPVFSMLIAWCMFKIIVRLILAHKKRRSPHDAVGAQFHRHSDFHRDLILPVQDAVGKIVRHQHADDALAGHRGGGTGRPVRPGPGCPHNGPRYRRQRRSHLPQFPNRDVQLCGSGPKGPTMSPVRSVPWP